MTWNGCSGRKWEVASNEPVPCGAENRVEDQMHRLPEKAKHSLRARVEDPRRGSERLPKVTGNTTEKPTAPSQTRASAAQAVAISDRSRSDRPVAFNRVETGAARRIPATCPDLREYPRVAGRRGHRLDRGPGTEDLRVASCRRCPMRHPGSVAPSPDDWVTVLSGVKGKPRCARRLRRP
jgi:hypothetical protein